MASRAPRRTAARLAGDPFTPTTTGGALGVRIDSGVSEGDDISVNYDPLVCKVIASAEARDAAIARASVDGC